MKRVYIVFVTIFWFTMIGLFFHREVLPALLITNPSGYEIELTKDTPVRESWMGIYFKDKKIGFSNTTVLQDVDNGVAGYRMNEITLLRLTMLGEYRVIRIKGESFLSEGYVLKNFRYKLSSGEYKIDVSGYTIGDNLNVIMDVGGQKTEKAFKIKPNTLIASSMSPILLFKKLDSKKEVNFEIFDPVTFGTEKVSVRNLGKDVLEIDKVSCAVDIFETKISGITTKTWMARDGDILKEESPLGFTMQKEDSHDALQIAGSVSLEAQDLAVEFSVPVDREILNPRDVSYLRINKNGTMLEIFKDNEPLPEYILPVPIEDIPDEDFVQSKNEKITALAEKIRGNEKNSWVVSKNILRWVYENIKKAPTLSIPSSVEVLRTMQGDCNEHTVLFTAIARSLGIPVKMIAGLLYLDGEFYYHAWPKVYVGEWINMDPTIGQEIADATHIPLLEGGVKEQLELINIIGELKIEVVEYR